jgi:hypothetical protein
VVPTWTLAIVVIAGVAVGVLLGRLTAPSRPSGGSAAEPVAPEEAPAAPVGEPAVPEEAEAPRIDMEDVVSELERRYQGRRAEEEKERARRKPPAEGT